MRLLKKMISAFLVVCMVISMVPMAALATETDSAQSVEGRIIMDQSVGSSVWIDGIEYAVQNSGGSNYVDLPAGAEPSSMVTYSYHVGDADDVHTQYPVGMQVCALKKNADGSYTPEKVEELNNILQYAGSSIRITGKKGIRMITSIEQNKKNDLTSGGLGGYKLLEYGTVLAWSSDLAGGNPLVLGPDYAKSNYAYKKGVADPVFAYEGNLMQYTNVLVDFTMDECKDDVAMRSYMILEDASGKQMTIYGGTVHRSIGYIAWQNKDVFTPGSTAYNYVWEIIRHVYAEVTFETNGGSAVESVFVHKGNILEKPADPEKEGYTFGGWYKDEALTEVFDFTAPVTNGLTLYASWGFTDSDGADTDNDGISDAFEEWIGSDPAKDDTDGDGLLDSDEIKFTGTDPVLSDSDGDGVNDSNEDLDDDGLSNLEEIQHGTNPTRADSDADSLNDADELNHYGTDPNKYDTDGDGVSDGDEILLGLNPLSASTDGMIPDADRTFEQTLSDKCIDETLYQDNTVIPSIEGDVPDNISKHVTVSEDNITALEDNRAAIGKAVCVNTDYEEGADLQLVFSCVEDDDRFDFYMICQYADGEFIPCETNQEGNRLWTTVNNGTYFVVDAEQLLIELGIPIEKYKNAEITTFAVAKADVMNSMPPAPSNDVTDEWYEDNYIVVDENGVPVEREDLDPNNFEPNNDIVTNDEVSVEPRDPDANTDANTEKTDPSEENADEGIDAVTVSEQVDIETDTDADTEEADSFEESADEEVDAVTVEEQADVETDTDAGTEEAESFEESADEEVDVVTVEEQIDVETDVDVETEEAEYSEDSTDEEVDAATVEEQVDVETDVDAETKQIDSSEESSDEVDNATVEEQVDVDANVGAEIENNITTEERDNEEVAVIPDDIGIFDNLAEGEYLMLASAASQPATFAAARATSGVSGQADIVFVIDTTGSMSGAINNVVSNIDNFVDALQSEYSVKANFALVDYKDITCNEDTILVKNGSSAWYSDVASFKSKINSLYVTGGGDGPETAIDGLAMAHSLDFRQNANKFIILVTDANYKNNNNYGISNMDEMTTLLEASGIITSVISSTSYESIYHNLYTNTGGVFGNIYGDFKTVLLQLADNIGEIVNDGSWVLLSDYQFIKLDQPLDESGHSSDADELSDVEELGDQTESDVTPYINWVLKKYNIPEGMYDDPTTVKVYKYKSNPILLDTDYDGIDDDEEISEDLRNYNTFFAHEKYSTGGNSYNTHVMFDVDYRHFFSGSTTFNQELAVLASLFALDMYDDGWLEMSYGANGSSKSENGKSLGAIFGMKDGKVYTAKDLRTTYAQKDSSGKTVDEDDVSEVYIAHRPVEYRGEKREIFFLMVRGTNGTNAEWSSNFDVGADTTDYYERTGSHPDWSDTANHKGFDVAKTRILSAFNAYVASLESEGKLDVSAKRSIFISGHSRGAAIANLLGAHFEDRADYTSYVYTMACPYSTTHSNAENYNTIFNIVNEDDLVPYLPLESWGFKKYGETLTINATTYEDSNPIGDRVETFEFMFGKDYDSNAWLDTAVNSFEKMVGSRNAIYILDTTSGDGVVTDGSLVYFDDKHYTEFCDMLEAGKLDKFCKTEKNVDVMTWPGYNIKVTYCPAYAMQIIANLAASPDGYEMMDWLGIDLKGKYSTARRDFALASGKIPAVGALPGGMEHPHMPATYYMLTRYTAYGDYK